MQHPSARTSVAPPSAVARLDKAAWRCCADGENPAPTGRFSTDPTRPGLAQAEQLHGKESYNNSMRTQLGGPLDHEQTCVAIIKHANPCGTQSRPFGRRRARKAHECDKLRLRRVIAANGRGQSKWRVCEHHLSPKSVVAPGHAPGALDAGRAKNIRVLVAELAGGA